MISLWDIIFPTRAQDLKIQNTNYQTILFQHQVPQLTIFEDLNMIYDLSDHGPILNLSKYTREIMVVNFKDLMMYVTI